MRFANDVSASSYTQTGLKKAPSQRNIQQVMIFTRKDKDFFADFIENARSPVYQCLLFVALVALVALVAHVTDVIFYQEKKTISVTLSIRERL